ncbi:hypothetical protein PIIN_07541 [Serendipita indica DSM 11827]|uniref:Uncharacterized protein n=1 Tax=Serendipita indica (strain DSM 11827) TaxID=1109443 RepID=G4TQJ4_SERID|nr:hypothetical protein PIIN_07541 [Serendipita indica DSM 11827]
MATLGTRSVSLSPNSASRTSTTIRTNAVLSFNPPPSSQVVETAHQVVGTLSSYEADATTTRAKGPSRVAIAVGVVLAILAVTSIFVSLFLFLKSRRRHRTYSGDLHSASPFTHRRVHLDPGKKMAPVKIHVKRVHDWSDAEHVPVMPKGVGTSGSAERHRPFRVPRKLPPSISSSIQVPSMPELVSEEHSEGASTFTLPATPTLQKPIREVGNSKLNESSSKGVGIPVEDSNGQSRATSPIPIPGVHGQLPSSFALEAETRNTPLHQPIPSVDHVQAITASTPTGPEPKSTTSPNSPSACLHGPFAVDSQSGLTTSITGSMPYFGSVPAARFRRNACTHTMSDIGSSQGVKIGFVPNNIPLVNYPRSHEGAVSARGSIHSVMNAAHGESLYKMRPQAVWHPHLGLKKARSAEAMPTHRTRSSGSYEAPESSLPSRSRTPIRRPPRKEVPRRLIAELEREIGGPSLGDMAEQGRLVALSGSSAELKDNLVLDRLPSSTPMPIVDTKRRGPRPRSSSHGQFTTTMF